MDIRKAITIVEGALREAAAPQLSDVIARLAQGWDVTFDLAQTEQGIEIRGGGDGIHPTDYLRALKALCHYADAMGQPLVQAIPLPDYGVIDQYGWLGFKVVSRENKVALVRREPRAPGAEPKPRPKRQDYPEGRFYLPTTAVEFYDDPSDGVGDEGWSLDELTDQIRKDGEIQMDIQVGRSVVDLMSRGDDRVFAFNGNHRLGSAKLLKMPFVPCENSDADDADPLTKQDIIALGGRLS